MSIIQKLSEGIVNRDMKKEGAALLSKWEATGLLEGIDTQQGKHNMARLLENQAKELLRESNAMSNGQVEGFASVAFPIVRRVFAGLIANDLVSVQPMSLPSGLIFFLDFVYSPRKGTDSIKGLGAGDGKQRTGNESSKSIYGTNQVGSEVINGVDIVGQTLKEDIGGLRGQVGYSYAAPTGSLGVDNGDCTATRVVLDSTLTDAQKKLIKYDPDILDLVDSSGTYAYLNVQVAASAIPADLVERNLSAIQVSSSAFANLIDSSKLTTAARQVRRLTHLDADGNLELFFIGTSATSVASPGAIKTGTSSGLTGSYPQEDTHSEKSGGLGAINGFTYPFEGADDMPEIDIKVDSIAITAQTKKLKAKWTPELGQDLNAYHNLDAEVELTSILSEQIALEIDRELLADLVNGATAATYYWSRAPGLFVNRTTGAELGASSAAPDFTGTVSEWYETLIETINDVSAQIHIKTLRGGANYVVCSPEVANILEFTSGFRANVTADADKGTIGAVKAGSLSRKFDVIVDPYFPRNAILVGRKGGSFLESGFVYAPYVPLQTTPTIFGVEDFVPRKGVMTRYAKKMVRPDMYGVVIVRGLTGEEGSS
jgi:hypothetical protein